MISFPQRVVDRFWSRVRKTDACWKWLGAKTKGYGVLVFVENGVKHRWTCHRLSVALDGRTIPEGAEAAK